MKNLASFLWGLMLLLLLACNNNIDEPVEVVTAYVKAIDKGDFAKAGEFITEAFKPSLENIANSGIESQRKGINYTFKLLDKEDSTAHVFLGVPPGLSDYTITVEFALVKRNGRWLINEQVDN